MQQGPLGNFLNDFRCCAALGPCSNRKLFEKLHFYIYSIKSLLYIFNIISPTHYFVAQIKIISPKHYFRLKADFAQQFIESKETTCRYFKVP